VTRKLFCEISPFCYELSVHKESIKRDLRDLLSSEHFAFEYQSEPLPNIVKSHVSIMLRQLHGVDPQLQINKITNIKLATDKLNGIMIYPQETFSFHRLVKKTSAANGYLSGLVVKGDVLTEGIGGGLCQLANLIHYLVLNSPLIVTELHHHHEVLFPDERRSVPFGTGVSIAYKRLDYRFCNPTDQTVQLLVWTEGNDLCGELRSEAPYPYRYHLVTENDHYCKEDNEYYRLSQVYRMVIDRENNAVIDKQLLLNNHCRVAYDHQLIPKEQIHND